MNGLKVNGTQEFMGKVIPVIEGGFGEDCRVVTDKMVAEIHGVKTFHVRELIVKNLNQFRENIDFIDLKIVIDATDNNSLDKMGYSKMQVSKANNIYALSERGYIKLISSMSNDNPTKWEVMNRFIDEYFTMRKVIKEQTPTITKEMQYVMDVYNCTDPMARVAIMSEYGKYMAEQETKRITEEIVVPLQEENKQQQETIQQQAPKVSYYDIILQSNNLLTSTDIAKDYGWSAVKLNKYLNEKGIIYDANKNSKSKSKKWTPYAEYQKDGIMQTFTNVDTKGESHITYKWTQAGRKFIYELLKKEDILPLCERKNN